MAYFGLFMHARAYGEPDNGAGWCFEFGDKGRDCVDFERDDHKDRGVSPRHLKIVRFDRVPTQKQVDAKRAELNAAPAPAELKRRRAIVRA